MNILHTILRMKSILVKAPTSNTSQVFSPVSKYIVELMLESLERIIEKLILTSCYSYTIYHFQFVAHPECERAQVHENIQQSDTYPRVRMQGFVPTR